MFAPEFTGFHPTFRNFFASLKGERKGSKIELPRFRSRKDHRQAIRFTANARFKVLPSGKLRLPKIGEVPVRWSRPIPSEPSSVTVIRDSAGRYFASFVVEAEPGTLPETDPVAGIDLGLKHFAILSDGTKITSPRFLRRAEKNLKRRQRELSRKEMGSRNREKARMRVARAHAKVADARRDFHHQLSTALIRDNQAVAVEDLAVKGLARTRMAKSVHDAGWSGFVAMLEYKARLYGRAFYQIGRFRADLPGVLSVRNQGRPEASACPGVDVPGVRGAAGPGHQCGGEHRQGRRAGGYSLWSAGKTTLLQGGAAQRSRNPPEVTPGSGVTGGNLRPFRAERKSTRLRGQDPLEIAAPRREQPAGGRAGHNDWPSGPSTIHSVGLALIERSPRGSKLMSADPALVLYAIAARGPCGPRPGPPLTPSLSGTPALPGRSGTRRYRGASWGRTSAPAARTRPLPQPA